MMANTDERRESFDSDMQYLGTVYAKALLTAADKSGNTPEVLDEFDSLVSDVLEKLPKFELMLSSPRVPLPDKIATLDKALAGKIKKELLNFLKVVVEHGRFDCLRAMNKTARRLFNESRGRIEVQVKTAEALVSQTRELVVSRLTASLGKEVEVNAIVDPKIIGGMVVRVGDRVFDGSVSNRLSRLRDMALEQTAQQIRDSIDRFTLAE